MCLSAPNAAAGVALYNGVFKAVPLKKMLLGAMLLGVGLGSTQVCIEIEVVTRSKGTGRACRRGGTAWHGMQLIREGCARCACRRALVVCALVGNTGSFPLPFGPLSTLHGLLRHCGMCVLLYFVLLCFVLCHAVCPAAAAGVWCQPCPGPV